MALFSKYSIIYIMGFALAGVFCSLSPTVTAGDAWTEPVPLSTLNWEGTDHFPCISADGKRLYYASFRPGGIGSEDIYYSDWDSAAEAWSAPVNCGPGVNSVMVEHSPAITSDGNRLYFVSSRGGGYSTWDVWCSDWDADSGRFLPAVNTGPNINTTCTEWSVGISRDGKTLYVASGYVSEFACDLETIRQAEWNDSSGSWEPSDFVEFVQAYHPSASSASVTTDGQRMYLCSWGGFSSLSPCFQGQYELYTAIWNGSQWDNAESLCSVNSPFYDTAPSITGDGRCLYFSSRRNGSDALFVAYNLGDTTYVTDSPDSPLPRLQVSQNYPNPFNRSTVIEFTLPLPAQLRCKVVNSLGQTIRVLNNSHLASGAHQLFWDGLNERSESLASGVYFYVLEYLGTNKIGKMVLLK